MNLRACRIAGAVLIVLAIASHGWTRGDVGLGLFGGKYCSLANRCEVWSWDRMQVPQLQIYGVAVVLTSVIAIALALAMAVRPSAGVGRVLRLVTVFMALAAGTFVVRFMTSFNRAPPIGWAPFAILVATVLFHFGARTSSATSPAVAQIQ